MVKSYEKQTCRLVKEESFTYDAKITGPDDVEKIARFFLEDKAEEYVIAIALNSVGDVVAVHEISHGTISASMVNPGEILKRILLNNASSFVIAHNHPSGNCNPSSDDNKVTERAKKAAEIIGVKMLDHLIIGDTSYSYANNGRI